ncbi:MAG: hypothetical protein Kow0020_09200 [Wenzhouxiangellaceae bacterium]
MLNQSPVQSLVQTARVCSPAMTMLRWPDTGCPAAFVPIEASKRIDQSHIRPLRDGIRLPVIIFLIGLVSEQIRALTYRDSGEGWTVKYPSSAFWRGSSLLAPQPISKHRQLLSQRAG